MVDKKELKVRKIRTRNYNMVIEANIPVRFYWNKDGYDGFEFTMIGCSKYERSLVYKIVDQLEYYHDCAMIATYMQENHPIEWQAILDKIESETSNVEGIPKAILEAFNKEV